MMDAFGGLRTVVCSDADTGKITPEYTIEIPANQ